MCEIGSGSGQAMNDKRSILMLMLIVLLLSARAFVIEGSLRALEKRVDALEFHIAAKP